MNMSILTWVKFHNDIKIDVFLYFSDCCEKVHNNIEFSCENSKPCCDSRITTH